MLYLNKILKNEKGMTLVELLAVFVLFVIVSVFVLVFFKSGLETTNEIRSESFLRDEADYIISRFIKEIYVTKQSHIIENNGSSFLEVTNDNTICLKDDEGNWLRTPACEETIYRIGFIKEGNDVSLAFKDETYQIQNKSIKIHDHSFIEGNPNETNLYKISLTLTYNKNRGNKVNSQLDFVNQIHAIQD